MTHLDLFSGIGGFALAARWAGIETVQFVEIDPFCQKVLVKNFPGVLIHADIKTFHYAGNRPFIITGGPPCQPASIAGKRAGEKDDRWLWPEALRVVSAVQPQWCIFENPTGILSLKGGFLFENLLLALEDQGYAVQAFVIPACAVNAPHRRDRVWIIAHASNNPAIDVISTQNPFGSRDGRRNNGDQAGSQCPLQIKGSDRHAPDADRFNGDDAGHGSGEVSQFQEAEVFGGEPSTDTKFRGTKQRHGTPREAFTINGSNRWQEPWLEVATRLCRVDDGLSRQVDRVNRLKTVGNSIVPQVAYEIMKVIVKGERCPY